MRRSKREREKSAKGGSSPSKSQGGRSGGKRPLEREVKKEKRGIAGESVKSVRTI